MVLNPEDEKAVKHHLGEAEQGDGLVKNMTAVYEIFVRSGLMQDGVIINSKFVGVHTQNRGGLGLTAEHCWDLLVSIASLGYSKAQASGIVVELGSSGDHVRQFNQELVDRSKGMLLCCMYSCITCMVLFQHVMDVATGF